MNIEKRLEKKIKSLDKEISQTKIGQLRDLLTEAYLQIKMLNSNIEQLSKEIDMDETKKKGEKS